jgi:hypothetical protein
MGDRPAVILANGDQIWYENGVKHRIGGPAMVKANGKYRWYENGVHYIPKHTTPKQYAHRTVQPEQIIAPTPQRSILQQQPPVVTPSKLQPNAIYRVNLFTVYDNKTAFALIQNIVINADWKASIVFELIGHNENSLHLLDMDDSGELRGLTNEHFRLLEDLNGKYVVSAFVGGNWNLLANLATV